MEKEKKPLSNVKNISKHIEKSIEIKEEPQTPKVEIKPSSFSQALNMDLDSKQQSLLSLKLLDKKYDDYEQPKFSNKSIYKHIELCFGWRTDNLKQRGWKV